MRLRIYLLVLISVLLGVACSHSNNLLLGEVQAKLGSHDVRVTDCYRLSVPQPTLTAKTQIWEPCRDAKIAIDDDRLSVNGTDYGILSAGDSVLVDHGVISVQRKVSTAPAKS